MHQLVWLDPDHYEFPPTGQALDDPDGLLAAGGDLAPERLIQAYRKGIFPWYSEGQPILWWTPSPRMVLLPENIHIGRSSKRLLKKHEFDISINRCFKQVIETCQSIPREGEDGTWITEDIVQAYSSLHTLGLAHSVEAWRDETLVGGLYGVALGKAFFGESMFSVESGASKVAFLTLAQLLFNHGFELIDCQIHTPYLASFGAEKIEKPEFEKRLRSAIPETDDIIALKRAFTIALNKD